MSKLSDNIFIRRVILFTLFSVFAFTGFAAAQNSYELKRLYEANDVKTIKEKLKNNSISNENWAQFFNSIFLENAEAAVQEQLNLYPNTTDEQLKSCIRKHIADFYSARGYYESARRILNENDFFDRLVSLSVTRNKSAASSENSASVSRDNAGKFGIQVGAFSTMQNARQAAQRYKRHFENTFIVEKPRGNENFYVVLIGKYNSRSQAENGLQDVNNKLKLKGFITTY